MTDDHDEQGRPWRWRRPLSRSMAEALSRAWAEGRVISEHERWTRHKDEVIAAVHEAVAAGSYGQLNEVRAWMVEQGITTLTEEADPKLIAQVICEEVCQRDVIARGLKGADMDDAYWGCMQECAPIQYPETYDPSDPLYPHSPEPEPEEFTTTYSLPERASDE